MSRPIHTDTRVLRPIVEALIFASEEPLAPRLLVRLLAGERDDPKSAAASVEEPEAGISEGPDAGTGGESAIADTALDEGVPPGEEAVLGEEIAPGEETTFPEEAVVDEASAPEPPATEPTATEPAATEPTDDDSMRLADGSESAAALASAYADLSREFSERLFPEEQIVTIDQRVVRRLIDDLNNEYEETGRAFRIVEVAGGFQFATIREYGEYVALLSKEKQRRRLSPAALETLAIIAFRQPISKPEIEAIRGVNSDQVLLSLLEKTLVAITGRSESVGRPLLYGTTDEFLRIFGLNSLNELPKLREIEELMEEDAYSAERIEVVTVDPTSDVEQIEAMVGAAGHEDRAAEISDETSTDDASTDEPAADEAADDEASADAADLAGDETSAGADDELSTEDEYLDDTPRTDTEHTEADLLPDAEHTDDSLSTEDENFDDVPPTDAELADDSLSSDAELSDDDLSPEAAEIAADIAELAAAAEPDPVEAADIALDEAISDPDGELDEEVEATLGDRTGFDVDASTDAASFDAERGE